MRRTPLLVAGGVLAGAGLAYSLEKAAARRWRADARELEAAGRFVPDDVRHRFVPVDDGGRLHVVERGSGRPLVLVHGVSLGIGIWVAQLQGLADQFRVIAVGQRGHGQSLPGDDGYSFDRLADDLLIVLDELGVQESLLVGHSMGGMVVQQLALRHPQALATRAAGLVLVATTAGGFFPPGPLGAGLSRATTSVAARGLRHAERRGRGVVPGHDFGLWGTRLGFGARPRAADIELNRAMLAAMSPSALHGLLEPLLGFDVRDQLHRLELPVRVVVGTRDLMTNRRMAQLMAERIPNAELVEMAGCGHMVMLERDAELNRLLRDFSAELDEAGSGAGRSPR